MQDTLAQLSDALVERAAVAQGFVIGIRGPNSSHGAERFGAPM